MKSAVAVLIAAAGTGTRLGKGPKAFVTVRGYSLIDICLRAVVGLVGEVVVALPAGSVTAFRASRASSAGMGATGTTVTLVAGGATRQESVAAMLQATRSPVVLIHDVARPFLTPAVLDRVASAAVATGAATAAVDVVDTVFDRVSGTTLDRSSLHLVQTPQGFGRELLVAAHAAATAERVAATDDAELVRRMGHEVTLVTGSHLLNKLTTPEDLALAGALYDLWLEASNGGVTGA